MASVLVVTKASSWKRMQNEGGLCPEIAEWIPNGHSIPDEIGEGKIYGIAPGVLETLDDDDRADLVSRFLDYAIISLVCWPDEETEDDSGKDPWATFPDISQWHRQMQDTIERGIGGRKPHLTWHLILVCLDDVPATSYESLSQLVDNDVFRSTGVMLRHLEQSAENHRPFSSRQVWPVAVVPLLIDELAAGADHASRRQGVFAWRPLFLIPRTRPTEVDSVVRTLQRELQQEIETVAASSPNEMPTPLSTELQYTPTTTLVPETSPQWYRFQWQRDWQLEKPPSASERESLRRECVEHKRESWRELQSRIQNYWGKVRNSFGFVRPGHVPSAPSSSLEPEGLDWQKIQEIKERIGRHNQELEAMYRELTRAQDGFLGLGSRLAVAAIVSAAMAIVLYPISQTFLESTTMAVLSSLSGACGTLAALVVSLATEDQSGRRAISSLQSQFQLVASDLAELRHEYWATLERGLRWDVQTSQAASYYRNAWLASRLAWLFDQASSQGPRDAKEGTESGANRQGKAFREMLTIGHDIDVNMDVGREAFRQLVTQFASRWHSGWSSFCKENDPKSVGHFPSQTTHDWIAHFFEHFRARAEVAIINEAVTNLGDDGLTAWFDELVAKMNHRYWEGMSARVSHLGLVNSQRADQPTLLLQLSRADTGCEYVDTDRLRAIVAGIVECDLLEHFPWIGMLCHRVRVQFIVDDASQTVVVKTS